MDNTKYNYLHFARFSNLVNWSVSHLLGMNMGFTHRFPLVSIGSVIERCKTTIDIDDNTQYKQITLKTNGGGAVLRDVKLGKDIGTKKQYVVSAGQFIMSKIDARNGAFGVVTEELDGAIVTADFPVFNVNKEKIIPQYLFLLSSTVAFARFAQSCSRGTTNRQRIDIAQFLSQRIPLPPLSEQKTLISAYKAKLEQSNILNKQTSQIEKEIELYLRNHIGSYQQANGQNTKDKSYRFLRFVRYKDINGWDVYSKKIKYNTTYKVVPLGSLITRIATGTTPPTSQKEYFEGKIKFFTPSDITDEMYLGKTDRFISQKAIDDNKARTFKKGDILFVGIGSTVGKVGIVKDSIVSSNQQITGFTLNIEMILREYAFYFMSYNKNITTKEQTKTTLPIVNQSKIINIPIPLPPIKAQKSIVEYINKQKDQIKQLKQQAELLKETALAEFEEIIFEI